MSWGAPKDCKQNGHNWDLRHTDHNGRGGGVDHYECRNCGDRRTARF